MYTLILKRIYCVLIISFFFTILSVVLVKATTGIHLSQSEGIIFFVILSMLMGGANFFLSRRKNEI